jgi:large subunit ribosomal protein L4
MEHSILTAPQLGLTLDGAEQYTMTSPAAFSAYVRALMQNWRQGTVGCKDRSEVAFSNRKPWRQKGTGRARAGSLRSPLWRKGGVIFGPQSRVRSLNVNRKVKQLVMRDLLLAKLADKRIVVLPWQADQKPSTAQFVQALCQTGLAGHKLLMFVDTHDYMTHASVLNVPQVRMITFDQVNAYVLAHGHYWVVLSKDLDIFKQMVASWI